MLDSVHFNKWDTQICANITMRRLSNILDPRYIPATYDDKMLFREQQHYMYAVLSGSSRQIKGRLFENTRVPLMPRVFTVNFKSTLLNLPSHH